MRMLLLFLSLLCIKVFSVDEPPFAGVKMSDSSDISSRSRVSVEVAKTWPCSTGVDSLVNLLLPVPYALRPA